MLYKLARTSLTLAALFAASVSVAPKAQAAEVLVSGAFSLSDFEDSLGNPLTLTPDPFDLSFSVVVTIDDATLASNGFFNITTVLDTMNPDPLIIGGEAFTPDQVTIVINRSGNEGSPDFHGLGVVLGIGDVASTTSTDKDFRVAYSDLIGATESTLQNTLPLAPNSTPILTNGISNVPVGYASNYSGSVSLSLVPEPTSLALLGLGGLLIARRRC